VEEATAGRFLGQYNINDKYSVAKGSRRRICSKEISCYSIGRIQGGQEWGTTPYRG
jgi:hypothetical protein